ncbi:TPA: hypothetical protein DCF80_04365 [Candidatus Saccharibacteria bacterium]|nr:hypothetical protein [Candidatus Saccharibacteria bacterium]
METPEPQVVTSRKKLSKKMLVLICAVLVALLLAGLVLWVWLLRQPSDTVDEPQDQPYTMTREEYAKVHVDTLKNDAPAGNASKLEKIAYYDELITTEFTANDHKGAVSTYETAVKTFGEANLSFNLYVTAARSYAKLGNTSQARAVLVVAEKFIDTSVSDESLRVDLKSSLNYFRKEIG